MVIEEETRADSSPLPKLHQDLESWYQQRSLVPICLVGESSFPGSSVVRNLPAVQETQEMWVQSLGQEDLLEREMATTPVLLPGKSHGWRSMVGYSPWGPKESDMTE